MNGYRPEYARKGNPLSKFEQIAEENQLTAYPSSQGTFTSENGNLLCRSFYSDIIYRVVGTEVEPYIHLTDSSGIFSIGDPMNIAEFSQKGASKSVFFLSQIKQTVFMEATKGGNVYTCAIMPKKTVVGVIPRNDLNGITIIGQLLKSDEQNVYYSLSPEGAKSAYERLLQIAAHANASIDERMEEPLKRFSANKNPIIQICTVKE